MKRKKMLETDYRASRFCRVLGNPTAYKILKILTDGGKTPSDLSQEVGLTIKTISDTLRNLRQVNLVRYDTNGNKKIYFIKDPSLMNILQRLEGYAHKMRFKKW